MSEPAPGRPDGRRLRLCQRLLRLAALLAPRGVRRRYTEEMLEVSLAGLRERSRSELALALCRELAGLVVLAIGAHLLGPFPRTTRRFRRSLRGPRLMDQLLTDLRFSRRTLSRRPGMVALAVLSLALGIGASTVSRLDPASLLTVVVAVAGAAIAVALPHCHRATNISPTTALREE